MKNAISNVTNKLFAMILLLLSAVLVPAQHNSHHASRKNADKTAAAVLPGEKIYKGESQPLGNGQIHTWVKFRKGKLTAIGITFDETALQNLITEPPPGKEGEEYVLALPEEAANTIFKHALVNWNPHGHPPANIYNVGHFDFHFYLIPNEERLKITAQGDDIAVSDKPLPAEFQPAGYILPPDTAVPQMGSHWVDANAHELHGQAFTKTFLYGSYDGKLIFLEPMITKAYLETKPNITEAIKLPAKFEKSGFYPTKYSIRYDEKTKVYTVALEGMIQR